MTKGHLSFYHTEQRGGIRASQRERGDKFWATWDSQKKETKQKIIIQIIYCVAKFWAFGASRETGETTPRRAERQSEQGKTVAAKELLAYGQPGLLLRRVYRTRSTIEAQRNSPRVWWQVFGLGIVALRRRSPPHMPHVAFAVALYIRYIPNAPHLPWLYLHIAIACDESFLSLFFFFFFYYTRYVVIIVQSSSFFY